MLFILRFCLQIVIFCCNVCVWILYSYTYVTHRNLINFQLILELSIICWFMVPYIVIFDFNNKAIKMLSANILCVLVNFNCHCGHVDLAFIQNMNYLILWYLCCWWSLKICMFSGKDRMSHILTFQWILYMCIYCWYQVISRRLLWARRGGSIFLHFIGNRLVTCQAYILSKLNICKPVNFYR